MSSLSHAAVGGHLSALDVTAEAFVASVTTVDGASIPVVDGVFISPAPVQL
jgi:hypothetical protein